MGFRKTNVKAHQRRNGIFVRSHDRTIRNRLADTQSLKPLSVTALTETPPIPPLKRQVGPDGTKRMVFTEYRDKERDVRSAYERVADPFSGARIVSTSAGGLALSVYWGTKLAGLTAFSFLPLITLPVMVLPILAAGVPYLVRKNKLKKEISKDIAGRANHPTVEQLDHLQQKYLWTPTSEFAKDSLKDRLFGGRRGKRGRIKSVSRALPNGGVAVDWSTTDTIARYNGTTFFHPEVALEKEDFPFPCDLRGANLQKANLQNSFMMQSNLDGANLSGANLRSFSFTGTMRETILDGADLRGANLQNTKFSGIDIRTCLVDETTFLPSDLRGVKMTGKQFETIRDRVHSIPNSTFQYDSFSFEDAIKHLGLTEKRFEYLVLSGALEARDNKTKDVVKSGFDPDQHHIPEWSLDGLQKLLVENSTQSAG